MLIKLIRKIATSRTKSQQFKLIGITGLVVVLFWNVLGQTLFKLPEAVFFQTDWWSVWFPNYIIWFGLLVIGLVIQYKENNHDIQISELHLLQIK